MKKITTKVKMIAALLFFIQAAQATIITITVQDFSFSPANISAVTGDTIMWTWVSGTHTTTSTSVPSGAATWDHAITSSSTSFQYKLMVAGTYSYNCSVHPSMMTGTITVTATGIEGEKNEKNLALFYPNPASTILNIKLNSFHQQNDLYISDILGREIYKTTLTSVNNSIDLSLWDKGIYFYVLRRSDEKTQGIFEVEK